MKLVKFISHCRSSLSNDPEQLEEICDKLVTNIVGQNYDFEYAVHWNKTRTNLHVHILFSERPNQTERTPKIYKRDLWQDRDTHKLAKANAPNAVLVHAKGEIKKDKNGEIVYEDSPFLPKNKEFTTRKWVQAKNEAVKRVLNEYGHDIEVNSSETPYLAQKKLYKGASEDYIEKTKEWNEAVKTYNTELKKVLELKPNQIEYYKEQKREILREVKTLNQSSKKITQRAIDCIKSWVQTLKEKIQEIKEELTLPKRVVAKGGNKGRALYRTDEDGNYTVWYADLSKAKELKTKGVKVADPYDILQRGISR